MNRYIGLCMNVMFILVFWEEMYVKWGNIILGILKLLYFYKLFEIFKFRMLNSL